MSKVIPFPIRTAEMLVAMAAESAARVISLSLDLETLTDPKDLAMWLTFEAVGYRAASKCLCNGRRLNRSVHSQEIIDATLEILGKTDSELADRLRACLADQQILTACDLSVSDLETGGNNDYD